MFGVGGWLKATLLHGFSSGWPPSESYLGFEAPVKEEGLRVAGPVFTFENMLFCLIRNVCIYATESEKKRMPPTLPPRSDNLLFYHDPEEKRHRDLSQFPTISFPICSNICQTPPAS